ncbi:phospholipase A2 phospholipin-like [Nilaparvata lugens]|uniref:phospholipase A2 phospholipin-like n=1 Tax=Nilaparvata lugens TaxID=108931 RepID=UPI00193E377B|nr:phospholipase A2 phospholipin-like [Nilaparvata lugens]
MMIISLIVTTKQTQTTDRASVVFEGDDRPTCGDQTGPDVGSDGPVLSAGNTVNAEKAIDRATRGSGPNPSTLLSGILPGTKWCGSGDIAETYYDLGTETDIDKCCRNHDICPSKVRPKTVRYNMTNNSPYTK